MKNKIQSQNSVDLRLSEYRKDAIRSIDWTRVDFSKHEKIEEAKKTITRIGILDSFIDFSFYGSQKQIALELIADKIICDMADLYEEEYGKGASAIENVKERRLAAHANLLDKLEPLGLNILLSNYDVEGSVWLTPSGTDSQLSHILKISVPHDEAIKLFSKDHRYKECAEIYNSVSNQSPLHVSLDLKKNEADFWMMAGEREKSRYALNEALLAGKKLEAECKAGTYDLDPIDSIYYEQIYAEVQREQSEQGALGLGLPLEMLREIAGRLEDRVDISAFALVNQTFHEVSVTQRKMAHKAADDACKLLAEKGSEALIEAKAHLDRLPAPWRLEALVRFAQTSLDPNRLGLTKGRGAVFLDIVAAASDLPLLDRRQLFVKLVSLIPFLDVDYHEAAYLSCWTEIAKINALAPRDTGKILAEIAHANPDDDHLQRKLRSAVVTLQDDDPHKREAQFFYARNSFEGAIKQGFPFVEKRLIELGFAKDVLEEAQRSVTYKAQR